VENEHEMEEGGAEQHETHVETQPTKTEQSIGIQVGKRTIAIDYGLHGYYFPGRKQARFTEDDEFGETDMIVRLDYVSKVQMTEIKTRTQGSVPQFVGQNLPLRPVRVDEHGNTISAQGEHYCSALGLYDRGQFCRITGFGPDGDTIRGLFNNPNVHYVNVLGENMLSRGARQAQFKMPNPQDARMLQGQKSLRVIELVVYYKDGTCEKLIKQTNMEILE
jgi:hypothetical protein